MRENEYQSKLKKKIIDRFPGAIVKKNDPSDMQGFPDLTVYYGKHYALLEVKRDDRSSHRPNQDYYIDKVRSEGGLAFFISPEKEELIFNELETAFQS